MSIFGIPEEVFLDKNKIKIIDGIAGSAKSSGVDSFLKERGIDYFRVTSTNKLKRDALERYGGHVDTIAGGLFNTEDGLFFSDEKDIREDTVVIDEALQTSHKVFEWCRNHVGEVNIIITTDSRQLLAPENEDRMRREFEKLKSEELSVVTELTETKRARTEETKKVFKELFESVDEDVPLFYSYKKRMGCIPFADLELSNDSVYIFHTNEIEKEFYNEFGVSKRYDLDLLPKGMIARKNVKDIEKYPIMCQLDASGSRIGYWQPINMGTATRYQGSEVDSGKILYYICEKHSKVSAREWYTVCTRCWDIRSLKIVEMEIEKPEKLTEFAGKPIRESKWFIPSGDIVLSDGITLEDKISGQRKVELEAKDMEIIRNTIKDTDGVHYRDFAFFLDGVKITEKKEEVSNKKDVTLTSMLKKEPEFSYGYMDNFYRSFERVQKSVYFGGKVECDSIRSPFMNTTEERNGEFLRRDDYAYALDLKAAYPHVLKFAKLPTSSKFFRRPDNFKEDVFHTEVNTSKYDWFVSGDGSLIPYGSVCSGDLARFIQDNTPGGYLFFYMGSSTFQVGSRMGEYLHDMAHRSIEAKDKIKKMKYGILDRQYLEGIGGDGWGEVEAYARNEFNNRQPLMVAIRSEIALVMAKCKKEVYGNLNSGVVNVDCLYFDYEGDILELGARLSTELFPYDFRITENKKDGKVLFQTYENLPTEEEFKKIQKRKKYEENKKKILTSAML